MGALGSQVFLNLMRMGFGGWILIDKDYLLPHNLARHGLDGLDVGYSKAVMLALLANQTIKGTPIASAIVANILNPTSEQAEVIAAALKNAEILRVRMSSYWWKIWSGRQHWMFWKCSTTGPLSMSRAFRTVISDAKARIAIWQTDSTELSTTIHRIDLSQKIEQPIGDWMVCTDPYLLDKIWQMRAEKLPNETGGVLIGSFDMQRKMVYIVDLLPSPPDSTEWPTVYIRGCKGLTQDVGEIERLTAGMLVYVGEWHSHPRYCGCSPSQDDRRAFRWLTRNLNTAGFPALMLIVGDDKQYCWYLGQMP